MVSVRHRVKPVALRICASGVDSVDAKPWAGDRVGGVAVGHSVDHGDAVDPLSLAVPSPLIIATPSSVPMSVCRHCCSFGVQSSR